MDVDCLIIGGGPTGLTLGIGLLKTGRSVVIAEKHPTQLGFSRALLVSSDSLQFLEKYGVTPRLQAVGVPLDGLSCYVDERLVSSCQFDTSLTHHPVVLPQELTERCLKDIFLQAGGQLLLGYTFDPTKNDVARQCYAASQLITLSPSKENAEFAPIAVRCQWLLGCDGTKSAVRTALGINYPGSTIEDQRNYVMDLELYSWPYPTMFTMWFEAADSGLVLRLSDEPMVARIVGTTERSCKRLLQFFDVKKVLWESTYISSYRLADSYGRGRVWLAGDACHVHSPLGGRGMNTGFADAIALAAAIDKGDLSTYEVQRRPAAQSWIRKNYILSQIAMGRGWVFYGIRYVAALAIRGLVFLLGPNFSSLAFQIMTTSVVKRKVAEEASSVKEPNSRRHKE